MFIESNCRACDGYKHDKSERGHFALHVIVLIIRELTERFLFICEISDIKKEPSITSCYVKIID